MNVCGNQEVLIGYVYDECEPAEGESIAAHVAMCASCTEEIKSLRDTRAHLGAWTPPALALGFQVTRVESEAPAHVDGAVDGVRVLRPAAWWSRPLPAWAQVAAAVVIFAAGMSVNTVRSSGQSSPASVVAEAPTAPAAPVVETSAADDMRVTRAEFARLEARLRSMENADVQRVAMPLGTAGGFDDTELSARVSALAVRLAENDRRMVQLISTVATLAQEAEEQRESTQRVVRMQEDVQDLRQAFRTAIVPSLGVRTSLNTGGR